ILSTRNCVIDWWIAAVGFCLWPWQVLSRRLFAAGFDCRDFREIGREIVRGKGLNIHFNQADKGTAKIRFRLAAEVNNHAYRRDGRVVRSNDVDRFLDASASGHHIFDDDESFIRRNLKSPPKDKFALLFLDENVAFA